MDGGKCIWQLRGVRPFLSDKYDITKHPNYKGIELLPLSVIEAARAGDAGAVERVLQYYSGYMNKLCTRTLYDENGYPHVCLDEAMKRRLEIKLIHAIVTN